MGKLYKFLTQEGAWIPIDIGDKVYINNKKCIVTEDLIHNLPSLFKPSKTKERHKYVASPMITKSDVDTVNSIKKKLELCADSECMGYDLMAELDTLDRLVENLRIAPLSYREASQEDVKSGYFTALCSDCGWWGSSKLLSGGDLIEDTGGYDDYRCPVCGSIEVYEK